MSRLNDEFDKKFDESIKNVGEIPKHSKKIAITSGVGAGTAAAVGGATIVAAIGTASTGTAIATLSGAAATNATLALIGGGTLAAGGGGILLGTAILTGGGSLIAIGVGFGVWKLLTRKKKSK